MYRECGKRLLDVVISFVGIVLLSPVFVLLAYKIRKNLGTPVIFTQERPGLHGKVFKMYKFRSMTEERDENGELLPDEKRLTDFGKKLRSTSLDELPELFNVLKGDMSLIGPRPLLVQYLPLYNKRQRHRHDVRPGITGLAQVKGRNSITWEEKFEWDLKYVKEVSPGLDLKILLWTVRTVLQRDGIHQADNATMKPFEGTKENPKRQERKGSRRTAEKSKNSRSVKKGGWTAAGARKSTWNRKRSR